MKNITSLLLLLLLISCSKDDIVVSNEEPNSIEWSKQASIPNNLRINAPVVTHNNEAYLMPGRGGSRFGIEPEVLKYSNNIWTEISTYDGWAKAGSYGAWRNGDLIYLVGGINGSSVPTDEMKSFSLANNGLNSETQIPSGNRASSSSCYSQSKGYVGYGFGFNPNFQIENEIWSYDFTYSIWESIPAPPISQTPDFSLMTYENNSIYILFPTLEPDNFYRLEEGSKEWIKLPNFPGDERLGAIIVSTETDIYTGMGRAISSDGNIYGDIWKYDIEKNEWVEFAQYPGASFHSGFAFELNSNFYFGGGSTEIIISNSSLNDELYQMRLK